MSRFVTSVRWLLVALLALPGLAITSDRAVAAQRESVDTSSYESELSGLEIEIDGDEFEIYEAEVQNYRHGQGEIVQIASNTSYIQIAFFDDTDTNEETLEIYNRAFSGDVDEFEVLDEGSDGDTVFTFAIASYNGVEFYYYLSVTPDVVDNVDVLQRIYATDTVFLDDLADAQDAISIGREGFLENVDVDELGELAGEDRTRDEPTPEPEDEPTEEPEEEPTVESDPGPEPTEAPEEEPIPTIDPAGATVRDLAVVDAQLVASPNIRIGQGGADPPGYEEIPMQYGEGEALLVLLMRPYSPEGTLDTVLSVFTPEDGTMQNLGTDADRTSAWSLDLVESPAGSYLLYSHVRSDRFDRYHFTEVLFTPVDSLMEFMDGFGENVQIGGVPMFHQADRETIEWLLGGGSEPETPGGEREDEKEGTEESGQGSGELDLESQGLVSQTEYVSPQYDVPVEWDDSAWFVDTEWEFSASSDTETGVDSVILFRSDDDASLVVQIMPSDGLEPEEFVEYWASDDYVTGAVHDDAEVLLSDSGRRSGAVIYLSYDAEGEELIVSQEAIIIDDDVVAIVVMYTTAPVIADAYADAEDFISVDGHDAAGTFTSREIQRAVDP